MEYYETKPNAPVTHQGLSKDIQSTGRNAVAQLNVTNKTNKQTTFPS
jgi:hypothetical protein